MAIETIDVPAHVRDTMFALIDNSLRERLPAIVSTSEQALRLELGIVSDELFQKHKALTANEIKATKKATFAATGKAIEKITAAIAEKVAARFAQQDARIAELEARLVALEKTPVPVMKMVTIRHSDGTKSEIESEIVSNAQDDDTLPPR